jgi:hypothetical protein
MTLRDPISAAVLTPLACIRGPRRRWITGTLRRQPPVIDLVHRIGADHDRGRAGLLQPLARCPARGPRDSIPRAWKGGQAGEIEAFDQQRRVAKVLVRA